MSVSEPTVFFVVGAGKAGTSSLHRYLQEHPAINVVERKDVVCFFCEEFGMPLTFEEYRAMLLPAGTYAATGECCHAYLSDTGAAKRIADRFPDARIVIILRNPAERAFSLYQWQIANGFEEANSFEEALELEKSRLARNLAKHDLLGYTKNFLYYHSGLYAPQIEAYLSAFPRDNVLILKFDDLEADPRRMIQRIYGFLGVDSTWVPCLRVHNPRSEPRSIRLQHLLRRRFGPLLPGRHLHALMRLNIRPQPRSVLAAKTRRELLRAFAPDIKKTQELSGLDLREWLAELTDESGFVAATP
jgi:hypothetical protein